MRRFESPNKVLAVLGGLLLAAGLFKAWTGELDKDDGLPNRARVFGNYPLDGDELDKKYTELREAAAGFEATPKMWEQYRRECQLSLGKSTSDAEDQLMALAEMLSCHF